MLKSNPAFQFSMPNIKLQQHWQHVTCIESLYSLELLQNVPDSLGQQDVSAGTQLVACMIVWI